MQEVIDGMKGSLASNPENLGLWKISG